MVSYSGDATPPHHRPGAILEHKVREAMAASGLPESVIEMGLVEMQMQSIFFTHNPRDGYTSEQTLLTVCDILKTAGATEEAAQAAVDAVNNIHVYFRQVMP